MKEHKKFYYLVFRELSEKKESGDDDVVDTPVPIPNTEVKHHRGYGILLERAANCRALFLCVTGMLDI